MRTWRWAWFVALAGALPSACSGAVDSTPSQAPGESPAPTAPTTTGSTPAPLPGPAARTEKEVAREVVGASGGSVAGGGMTVDIPAGALAKNETIVIKTVTDKAFVAPAGSSLVGSIYAIEPENVTFAMPVTVTVQFDPATRPLTGSIDLMRSPRGTNQWTALAAVPVYEWRVQASTTHFSDWAAMSSSEVIDGGPCSVKGSCAFGSGGSTTDSSFTSYTMCRTSNTTNELSCEAPSGSDTWTCSCTGTASFTVVQSGLLTSDQLAELWTTKCTGTCIPPKPPPPWFDAGPAPDAAGD